MDFAQRPNPLVLPQQAATNIFGFKGNPATITVKKADGVYVDGQKVEQPEQKEPQNGN
jgi:hypothetical protein